MIRRGPRPVTERLRRLLVMLPWLMERGEVAVAEAAARFDVTETELIRDLELAAMCGLPPFVDEMIDLFVDEGTIYAGVPRLFTRPLRLTAPEAFGLLAAARSAMQLPGADEHGSLARAIDKMSRVLGDDGIAVEQLTPPLAAELVAAAEAAEVVTIDHWSPSREEMSRREVTPRAVFADRGHWYVIADDHERAEERTFRIDRIQHVAHTGRIGEHRPVAVPDEPDWFADSDLPSVHLRVNAGDEWLLEQFPHEHRLVHGDDVHLVLRVSSSAWLGALLVRAGRRVEVIEPAEWRSLAATTAQTLLARYRTSPSS